MKNFKNKYRSESIRLQTWDYRKSAAYFVTICTHKRAHYFGYIIEGQMHLSKVGIIADLLWYEIKNHSTDVQLGEFIVMPDHIHCIVIIEKDELTNNIVEEPNLYYGEEEDYTIWEDWAKWEEYEKLIQTPNEPKTQSKTIGQQRFQNIGKNSLSSIIGSYKSAVTKHANRFNLDFKWQPRFYEHIIRNEKAFNNISQYIINNPQNW